jgi:Uma2 family endonuclease
MGTSTTLVTVQEFMQLVESNDQPMELIGGEVVTMGSWKVPHEFVKSNLIQLLAVWLAQNPIGRLLAESIFRLNEHDALMPDLAILFPGRVQPGSTELICGAPELAIEVVSSEAAERLEQKIELYFAHGSKSVWVVYPKQRVVRIFDAGGQSRKFEQNQTIEDPAVLPGFSTPVSTIFEGI